MLQKRGPLKAQQQTHTPPSHKINLGKPTKKPDYYTTSRAQQIPQSHECSASETSWFPGCCSTCFLGSSHAVRKVSKYTESKPATSPSTPTASMQSIKDKSVGNICLSEDSSFFFFLNHINSLALDAFYQTILPSLF